MDYFDMNLTRLDNNRVCVIGGFDFNFDLCCRDANGFKFEKNKEYLGKGYIKNYRDNSCPNGTKRQFHFWIEAY